MPGPGGVCSRGESVPTGVSAPGGSALGEGMPAPMGVPGGDPPDSYCCGWCASYWNAFLFHRCLSVNRGGVSVSGPMFLPGVSVQGISPGQRPPWIETHPCAVKSGR